MKFQLVIQFPASSIEDYDEMLAVEEAIRGSIGNLGVVDGHDAGSGEVNIFLFTNEPDAAFAKIKQALGTQDYMNDMRVAYRVKGEDDFTILHPQGLKQFTIV